MALREIVRRGDDILSKTSRKVDVFGQRLWTLIDDMKDTMKRADGVGIAAVQVGVLRRIFLAEADGVVYEFINPVITKMKGMFTDREGCLSCPGLLAIVKRAESVTVEAQNRNGDPFKLEVDGFLARVIQHEMDHLNGKLCIDVAEKYGPKADILRELGERE